MWSRSELRGAGGGLNGPFVDKICFNRVFCNSKEIDIIIFNKLNSVFFLNKSDMFWILCISVIISASFV